MLDAPRIHYAEEPALTPDGVETIARCAKCGAPYVPASAQNVYCSDRCRYAAKTARPEWIAAQSVRSARAYIANASYRQARRCLLRAGIDPDTRPEIESLRGAGLVADWRERVGLPRRSSGPRRIEYPTHLGTYYALDLRPRPEAITLRHTRHLHGIVCRALGVPHEKTRGVFSLVPSRDGCGWGALVYEGCEATITSHAVHVGGRPADLAVVGLPRRVKAPPPVPSGRHRVTIETITPVSWARESHSVAILAPKVSTLEGSCEVLGRRALVSHEGARIFAVDHDLRRESVYVGGHVARGSKRRGEVIAVVGIVTVTCNAHAAWLLLCAERLGIGGATALGFGRVKVTVTK
jgi:hypothetical protein